MAWWMSALSLVVILLVGGCSDRRPASASASVERIVSLSPSTTDLLAGVGAIDRLVGRDQYSVEPASILPLPVLGDFLTPNIEAIVALEPDLVLLDSSQARAAAALAALDIPTLALAMHEVADIRRGLVAVGQAIGRAPQAEAQVKKMDAAIARHAGLAKGRVVHPRVLFLIDRSPEGLRNLVAAGPNTYLDELLTIVGGVNMMAGSPVRYPQLSAEQILRGAPDIIIDLSKSGDTGLAAYQLVREAPAVAHGRIHIVDERLLLSPSPRLGEALDTLSVLVQMQSAL